VIPVLLALLAAGRVVTLEEALRAAREHQPQLRLARAGSDAAGARARQAFAPLLPQVSGTARYTRSAHAVDRTVAADGTIAEGYNSFLATIGASQLLWDFGAKPYRWKAAQASARASEDTALATALLVELNVRSAYSEARANRALAAVADESLQNQQRHLEQIQGFVGAGTRPEIDLAQARTDTANARVALINAENAYQTSKLQLNAAMGVEGPTDYELGDERGQPVGGEDGPLQPLLDEGVQARPDLASLAEQIRAEQLTLRAFEGQYGPALSANLGFTQTGPALDRLGWNASAGLTLSWDVFQGGLTRAQVGEAEANVAGAVAQLDLLRQQIRVDVDGARLAVRAAKASLGAAQEALVNARERLRLAEQRYEVGVGSAIELGDAQVALTQAGAQLVQADDRLALARAQLMHALGRHREQ
jgi:outer membrane protein